MITLLQLWTVVRESTKRPFKISETSPPCFSEAKGHLKLIRVNQKT